MIISLPLPAFRDAFNAVARAVPSRTPRPVLLCVRLDLAPGDATFSSTNLEMWIRHRMPIDYAGDPTSILLDRSTIADILRAASGDAITLQVDGNSLTVLVGRRKWTMPTDDPAIFPSEREKTLDSYHEVDAEWLATAIKRVVKESRPGVIDGQTASAIEFQFAVDQMILTSANGRSLATQAIPANRTGDLPAGNPLVPDAAIKSVQALLSGADDPVRVGFPDANTAMFVVGSTTMTCRLAEGQFVKWKQHVDRFPAPVGSFQAPCKAIRQAVQCACISLDEENRALLMKFTPDELHLSTGSHRGQSNASEPISYDGPERELCVDPQFIRNMLATVGDDNPITISVMPDGVPLRLVTQDGFLGLAQLMERR